MCVLRFVKKSKGSLALLFFILTNNNNNNNVLISKPNHHGGQKAKVFPLIFFLIFSFLQGEKVQEKKAVIQKKKLVFGGCFGCNEG